ncbi:MAG: histidinol-phosphate aminotransferase [Candidatus Marinamargulisbacteria bacterium]
MFEKIARKTLETIKPYIPGQSIEDAEKEFGVTGLVKMASNENPIGCSVAPEELSEAIQKAYYYPDLASAPLIGKLATKSGLSNNQIVLGNGSDELILMVVQAFLNPGEEVVTSEVTFSEYAFSTKIADGHLITVPMKNEAYDLDAIAAAITLQTRVVYIANPNNPTGTYVNQSDLETFLKRIPPHVIVVSDEAYVEYATASDFPNTVPLMAHHKNLLILRTFSKIYGLAGFRIGYGFGHESLISCLNKVRLPFNINSLALKAAEIAIDNQDHLKRSRLVNSEGMALLTTELQALGLRVVPSQANFLCIHLDIKAAVVCESLIKKGFIVRSLQSFGWDQSIRVTIGLPEQNIGFVAALKSVLREGESHE